MGMFSEGMISKLNKQAEEALKPKEEVIGITANEAKAKTQKALSSGSITQKAKNFIIEKVSPYIKERAEKGYESAIISLRGYSYSPDEKAILNQVIELLKQNGFSASIYSGKTICSDSYVRGIYISWKEEE